MTQGPHHHLYGVRWQRARAAFLRANPLCRMCEQDGRGPRAASVVDHIKAHGGDYTLFWDQANWQPLCQQHHDGAKQSQDKTGRVRGCDAAGVPLDEGHHWRRS